MSTIGAPPTFVTAVYHLDGDDPLRGRAHGMGPYLVALCLMADLGVPFVVYTQPEHSDLLRRFAEDERLTWDVVGVDLHHTPHFERIRQLPPRAEDAEPRRGGRCHALSLAKIPWLVETARRNPFESERLIWIDAGLATHDQVPARLLGPNGLDFPQFSQQTARAFTEHPRLFALGATAGVAGSLFGGPRDELDAFGRDYEAALTAHLDAGRLCTAEEVLTELHRTRAGGFAIEPQAAPTRLTPPEAPPDAPPQAPHATDLGVSSRLLRRFTRPRSAAAAERRPGAADVTVLLNTYKRPAALATQYAAVKRQSCPPTEVMVWQNFPDREHALEVSATEFPREVLERCTTVTSLNTNFGVWGRFAFALNARTRYVCVLDDDTIPGERWIENCLETIATHRGLLGTVGIVQLGDHYSEFRRVGWVAPNEQVELVDYVGHAWFFEREWLTAFWRELPDLDLYAYEGEPHALCAGEDMHFSYVLQKYLGLSSFVPPHPTDDHSLWGSDADLGWSLGTDSAAVSNLQEPNWKFDRAFDSYRARGFRFLYEG